jgi:hypothetical protein
MGELDEDTVATSDDSNATLSQGNIWSKQQHTWRSPSLPWSSQWIEATRGTPREQGILSVVFLFFFMAAIQVLVAETNTITDIKTRLSVMA